MKEKKLSVVIIAKNEEEMIGDCLKSVQWADEIILVDNGSVDKTIGIAKKYRAKVIRVPSIKPIFAKLRNEGLKVAEGRWILYVDADERVPLQLRRKIQTIVESRKPKYIAYEIPRRNFYLGKEVHYGGAWPDYVKRLFFRKALKGWKGELHENPVFKGKRGYLKSPFVHLTHRDLSSMVEKTRQWSKIEARLLYQSGHPEVTWWRILRVMLGEFWYRGIKLQGVRDGSVGWIEVIFQMFSRFITYARLWEMQCQTQNAKRKTQK